MIRVKKILITLLLIQGIVLGQDFETVPGVVINYIQSPVRILGYPVKPVYISDPSITVLDNGDYIASHARFGSGSSSKELGETTVFKSKDKGRSWQKLTTLEGILRASLFVHEGDLYLLGAEAEGKPNVIRKSADGGKTWTTPICESTGKLGTGGIGTPNNPVNLNGRIWSGATRRLFSAPVDADLLKASSWTITNAPSKRGQPFAGSWQGWTEGQAVGSRQLGIYVLPKIRALPYTALIKAVCAERIEFDASSTDAFAYLPGGEKKFGAGFDSVSGKFFVLSNPVLPAHSDRSTPPELIRTTAAVLSSKDLVNWNVEKIFLFTDNLDNGSFGEGFQYFNFDFDGEDIVAVSRTALDVGSEHRKPPRGHDSNLLTFHRIANFRDLSPRHILTFNSESSAVKREEITDYKNAPLGEFTLGSSFEGDPIKEPNGLAQDEQGNVYIKEAEGRILRFDALGNFIETVESSPAALQAPPLEISQPKAGKRAWINSGSGNWYDLENWYYWGRPDTDSETAVLGSAIEQNSTVWIHKNYTIKGLRFRSEKSYILTGEGGLTVESDAENGVIASLNGSHHIGVQVDIADDTEISAAENCSLRFEEDISFNGNNAAVKGRGQISFAGNLRLSGASLTLDALSTVNLTDTSKAEAAAGTLIFKPHKSIELTEGKEFKLFNGASRIAGRFAKIEMPSLRQGLTWDSSELYTQGVVKITANKE